MVKTSTNGDVLGLLHEAENQGRLPGARQADAGYSAHDGLGASSTRTRTSSSHLDP